MYILQNLRFLPYDPDVSVDKVSPASSVSEKGQQ